MCSMTSSGSDSNMHLEAMGLKAGENGDRWNANKGRKSRTTMDKFVAKMDIPGVKSPRFSKKKLMVGCLRLT